MENLTKKQAEQWFLGILKDLKIGENHENCINYSNSKGEWMIQDMKDGVFYLSFDRIWSVLRDTYGMDYDEFQEFTKSMLVKHLNWKVDKTYCSASLIPSRWLNT